MPLPSYYLPARSTFSCLFETQPGQEGSQKKDNKNTKKWERSDLGTISEPRGFRRNLCVISPKIREDGGLPQIDQTVGHRKQHHFKFEIFTINYANCPTDPFTILEPED